MGHWSHSSQTGHRLPPLPPPGHPGCFQNHQAHTPCAEEVAATDRLTVWPESARMWLPQHGLPVSVCLSVFSLSLHVWVCVC